MKRATKSRRKKAAEPEPHLELGTPAPPKRTGAPFCRNMGGDLDEVGTCLRCFAAHGERCRWDNPRKR